MFLDFLFPKRCINCEKFEDFLCNECKSALKVIGFQRCPNCKKKNFCGKFCTGKFGLYGKPCAENFYFDQLILCFLYDRNTVLQKLVINFKYKFLRSINEFFIGILVNQFLKFFSDFDDFSFPKENIVVVPVPMSKQKTRLRGENHAKILAYNFAKKMNLNFCDALWRSHREDQAKLKRTERLVNLRNSIFLKERFENSLDGKTIVLVDDIVTTCSTVNECSKTLKTARAKDVCVLALARG
ncbi:MAG: phosphoribosyltransferase family protein [Candidatus Gracilibacteria bacterium]